MLMGAQLFYKFANPKASMTQLPTFKLANMNVTNIFDKFRYTGVLIY